MAGAGVIWYRCTYQPIFTGSLTNLFKTAQRIVMEVLAFHCRCPGGRGDFLCTEGPCTLRIGLNCLTILSFPHSKSLSMLAHVG